MRPIYSIIILFLLTAASYAQLQPDKERFDVVLHPGDLEERTLTVSNIGDDAIYKISKTEISGTARSYIFLNIPDDLEENPLMPEDKAKIKVYFALPPEAKPGTYTGFLYLLDSEPPSLPIRIDLNLNVIAQESYGIGMTIDDAKSAELSANAEDIAQFDLSVKNLGAFRDVASIDAGPLPDGWSVTLLDGKKTPDFPYNLSIDPGTTHTMQLQIETTKPGQKENLTITATSLGNESMNSSVKATVDFAVAVRGYNVDIQVPDKMVVNKTYKGSFKVLLDVKETVMVGIITPPDLMVIPLAQTVKVDPSNPGIANFTMLASKSGEYPIIFRLMDSHGIPMPEEITSVDVVVPEGMAVLTGDDFIYSTIASSSTIGNGTVEFDLVTTNPAKINEADLERLQDYSEILILGNQSIVSGEAERQLKGSQIKRLGGDSLYEECWLYAANIWRNGTEDAILCDEEPADIFRAYSLARMSGIPIIVCQGNVTEEAKAAVKEMAEMNVSLTRALYVGNIDAKYKKPLQDAGIETEEVKE